MMVVDVHHQEICLILSAIEICEALPMEPLPRVKARLLAQHFEHPLPGEHKNHWQHSSLAVLGAFFVLVQT